MTGLARGLAVAAHVNDPDEPASILPTPIQQRVDVRLDARNHAVRKGK